MSRWLMVSLAAVIGIGAGLGLTRWTAAPEAQPLADSSEVTEDLRPLFNLAGLDGSRISAEQFAGRPVLVNFWATWCKPCVREMPMLDAFSREHADKIDVLGIAHDRPEPAREFIERTGVGYVNALGGEQVDRLLNAFGSDGNFLPYTALVDRSGRLTWRHLGELKPGHLDEVIAQLDVR